MPIDILQSTSCITNLMTRCVSDRFPPSMWSIIEEYTSHGIIANEAHLDFNELIKTNLCIRHHHPKDTFVIGDTDKDLILRMN